MEQQVPPMHCNALKVSMVSLGMDFRFVLFMFPL